MTIRIRSLFAFLLVLSLLPFSAAVAQDSSSDLSTEDDKILYAVGLAVAQQLTALSLESDELAVVNQGFSDFALGNEPKIDLQEYGPKIAAFAQARVAAKVEAAKAEAKAFIDAEAAKPGATTSDSGLVTIEIEPGTGESPTPTDTVTVHYHGTLANGDVFDSSVERGQPATFGLNQVIPCWTEGLTKMKVGGKSRLVCPSAIAYGDQGRPPTIPGGAALAFDVELIEIASPPSADEEASE